MAASGNLNGNANVVVGNANWSTQVQGVGAEIEQVREWSVVKGRFFDAREASSGAKVAVLGDTVANELFGAGDPVGATVRINNAPFQVLGVLVEEGPGRRPGPGRRGDGAHLHRALAAGGQARRAGPDRLAAGEGRSALQHRRGAVGHRARAARAAPHRRRQGKQFHHPQLRGVPRDPQPGRADAGPAAGGHRGDLAGGGWHRHHEHHAGVGHRAHPRDRPAHGHRRARQRHPAASSSPRPCCCAWWAA